MQTQNHKKQAFTRGDKTSMILWGLAIFTIAIWNVPLINWLQYPFILLGTWFHEMGHGLTAKILGGQFYTLELFANGSGLALCDVNNSWINPKLADTLVSLGGLLGPPIAGAILIISGRHKPWAKATLLILSFLIIISLFNWVINTWGIIIMSAIAVFLLFVFVKGSNRSIQLLVQFLGLQAALSTFIQIDYLFKEKCVVGGSPNYSDTAQIAMNTFGNYALWGILITFLTLSIIFFSFKIATKNRLFFESKEI